MTLQSTFLFIILLTGSAIAKPFVLTKDMSDVERKRFARFEKFQIKGVCGDSDIERLSKLGVNTVRGYVIPQPDDAKKKLDEATRFGMKMILSEWMPHHGKNSGKNGGSYYHDYNVNGDNMVAKFAKKVEGIGDHPAILMWGLGNEVPLDEPYLRVVNRMSKEIHQRFPHHLTSLTMVNAKPEQIEQITHPSHRLSATSQEP